MMHSVNRSFVKTFCISRMDSFFLAEMFKYLYLLFSEKSQLPFDIDDYIFTTEAHLLPVSLSNAQTPCKGNSTVKKIKIISKPRCVRCFDICFFQIVLGLRGKKKVDGLKATRVTLCKLSV